MSRRPGVLVVGLLLVGGVLAGALGVGTNAFTTSTPLPATTTVDCVRVWN
jgi:hypothetical protein